MDSLIILWNFNETNCCDLLVNGVSLYVVKNSQDILQVQKLFPANKLRIDENAYHNVYFIFCRVWIKVQQLFFGVTKASFNIQLASIALKLVPRIFFFKLDSVYSPLARIILNKTGNYCQRLELGISADFKLLSRIICARFHEVLNTAGIFLLIWFPTYKKPGR